MKYLLKIYKEIKLFLEAIGKAQLTEGLSYFKQNHESPNITFNDIRILIDGKELYQEVETSFLVGSICVKYFYGETDVYTILIPNQHYKLSLKVKNHAFNLGYAKLLHIRFNDDTTNFCELKFSYPDNFLN